MQTLSDAGRQLASDVAQRHGVNADAAEHLLLALAAGGGRQAQFNHPELGGMGQWSKGGMIMIGDMFNNALKARVDALCNDLSAALPAAGPSPMSQTQSQSGQSGGTSLFVGRSSENRWPAELGTPSSVGSQNDLHYAVFPGTRRLAIEVGGHLTVYDTGDHQISGFSQQQSGDRSVTFTSQHGLVDLASLAVVPLGVPLASREQTPSSAQAHAVSPQAAAPTGSDDEIFSRIERLAELRKKDIITAEEFDSKKAELLARL